MLELRAPSQGELDEMATALLHLLGEAARARAAGGEALMDATALVREIEPGYGLVEILP